MCALRGGLNLVNGRAGLVGGAAMYTVAFLEYRMDAVLKPTPDVAPVTMVTFPVKSGMSFSTKVGFGGKIWPRAGAIVCVCVFVYVCI